MKINEVTPFLVTAITNRRRVFMVGKPGIGKTDCVSAAVDVLRSGGEEWDFFTDSVALMDPAAVQGYPVRENGKASHVLFGNMFRAFHAQRPSVYFLDDVPWASEATIKSLARIIQHGEIDGQRLPDHVVFIAAGNDVTHGAGVYGVIEPFKGRWHTLLQVETDPQAVIQYGLAHGWATEVLAYLQICACGEGGALDPFDWKPEKSLKHTGATPRGYEYASQWFNLKTPNKDVLAGCVGEAHAIKMIALSELYADLPNPDACLLDPEHSPVPENPSARWLIASAMAARMTGDTFASVMTYCQRMPAMFSVFTLKSALEGENILRQQGKLPTDRKLITSSRDWTDWYAKHGRELYLNLAAERKRTK